MDAPITLVPIGPVPGDLLAWLKNRLAKTVNCNVEIGHEVSPPSVGYDPHRRQYRGDALIETLRALPYPGVERLLGLIDADCYAPNLNFIFGQATLGGREAFIALPRLRPSFYNLPEDTTLFRERVLKEAIHELGHTWGLFHCPHPHCVMHFSNRLEDTDIKDADFCPQCRNLMA